MIPRFGEAIVSGQRYGLRHGVYAIIWDGADVLLTHQAAPLPEFQLPGGGIDPDENPIRALHREVYEETGWHICAPRRLGAFRRFTYMPEYDRWAEKLCTVYLARPALRRGPPTEQGHTAVWAPLASAGTILGNAGDRHFMSRFVRMAGRARPRNSPSRR